MSRTAIQKVVPMSDQSNLPAVPSSVTEAASQWQALTDELITLKNANEAMVVEFEAREKKFESDLIIERARSAMMERRAIDAENRKDFYMRYNVELLTRLPMLRDKAEELEKAAAGLADKCEVILSEARDSAFRPNGAAPAPELQLGPEADARVKKLGETFGAGNNPVTGK